MHFYAMTEELKKKEFTINSQYLKQTIDLQVTFILEIKSQYWRKSELYV